MRARREGEARSRFAVSAGMAMAQLPPAQSELPPATLGAEAASPVPATFDPALAWRDLDWLASLSPLPILLKGVLHPHDAVRAIDHGAQGVIVSNHGGRQLDGAVAALDALPAVAAAVDGRAEILLDGGVRRGTDILKALALGARAVLIGRPTHWGLAVGGEAGVHHVLEMLRAELALDMMLCGLGSPAEVARDLLVPADTLTG